MLKSLQACANKEWTLATWPKDGGGPVRVRCFQCNSWRCRGECQRRCAAQDFARILTAIKREGFWTYGVLTYPGLDWPDLEKLFKITGHHWSLMRKCLARRYDGLKYIQTWEVHKSGVPHANVLMSSERLFHRVIENEWYEKSAILDPLAHECGFGHFRQIEPVRSDEAVSGYLAKLGLELSHHHTKDQTPYNAPRNFRRIRSSKGLLPPRFKDSSLTGALLFLPVEVVERRFANAEGEIDLSPLAAAEGCKGNPGFLRKRYFPRWIFPPIPRAKQPSWYGGRDRPIFSYREQPGLPRWKDYRTENKGYTWIF